MTARRRRIEHALLAVAGAILVVFLVSPIAALMLSTSPQAFRVGIDHPLVWPALRLSLWTTSISLALVVALGTPLAWTLSRSNGRLVRAVESIVQLPIVVPPAVAGVALLLAFGRYGVFAGIVPSLPFTTAAVVLAEVFVSAPFFIQAALSAFRRIDDDLLIVARTFGASPLRVWTRIALPLAAPGLVSGAAMSWARSLGEFGATLMFAGNLEGRTQTLPLAVYVALESDLRVAQALSIVLVVVAFSLLLAVRALDRRVHRRERA